MTKHILFAVAVSGLAANGAAAQAATCASRDALVTKLASDYSEHLTARGLQGATALMEVFTSDKTGTFTVLVTNPNGISCIVAAGTHWNVEPPEPEVAGIAG